MAVLGFHIVVTLIAASILQKLSARFSLGRKILANGLIRYVPPSTEELRTATGHGPTTRGAKKRHRNDRAGSEESEGFPVPKDTEFVLEKYPLRSVDVLQLPFYVDYRWLIDFTFCSLIVYSISEVYMWLVYGVATNELNLSVVWLTVVVALCLRSLASLSSLYFNSSEETGERSLVLCFGAIYFLFIMSFFMVAERYMDLELSDAYQNFTATANAFMKAQELDYQRSESSSVLLFLFFSLLFGFLSGMLVFPCFRYAKMYMDALRNASESPIQRLILHINFFSPLLCLLLWVRPLVDHLIHFEPEPLLSLSQVESLRLWSIVFVALLRLLTCRMHFQSYLNIAHEKVMILRTESGRINSLELQRMISRIFMYVCVTALQYFAPVILVLAFALLTKTMGNYTWLTSFGLPELRLPFLSASFFQPPKVLEKTEVWSSLASVYALFNPVVNRGVLGSVLVTTLAVTFSLNLIGVLYNTRFAQ